MPPAAGATALAAFLSPFLVGQALTLALLLAADPRERRAHRWLIVAFLALALNALGDAVQSFGLERPLALLLPVASSALLLMGPAIWLYARSLTEATPLRGAWRHFVPAGLLTLLLIPEALNPPPMPLAEPAGPGDRLAIYLLALHLGSYLALTVRRVRASRRALMDELSALEGRTLGWLLYTAGLFALVLVTWVASAGLPPAASFALTSALLAASLALAGVNGVRQLHVRAGLPAVPEHAAPAPTPEPAATAPGTAPAPAPETRYARSALDDATATRLRAALHQAMATTHPYLNPDLTLGDLARRVGATPHQLSQLFTVHLGETFYDFVNRHRVEAVKARLADPAAAGRSVLELGFEAGFGSKSTFNTTFRRLTGASPSEFRDRMAPGTHA